MAETTTVRVPAQVRDQLNALARRRGASAGQVVAELVRTADDDLLLAEAERAFENLARDRDALAAYHSEARDIETVFEAPMPDW